MRRIVVVAAKSPSLAKSRLALPDEVRRALAVAFARDVVAVAASTQGVDEVRLMTTDLELAGDVDAAVITDPVPGDLNGSLAAVAASLGRVVMVALLADIPSVREPELAAALAAGGAGPAYVPDANGTGTTCLIAETGSFDPAFGVESAAAHHARGARRLDGDWPGLRTDVDDVTALERVLELGVGPHTAAVLEGR